MCYLMFTRNDGRTEVHRYEETEVTEVFGADAPALDQHGYLKTPRRHLGRYGARGGQVHRADQLALND
jgi:hypothetical protein